MIRAVGLRQAVAVNAITMIGIGPLITIPLVLSALHGPAALLGWVLGAVVALCDGMIWAELGSQFPGSGSTYRYLRESFGRSGPGQLLAFLFVWQFTLSAPLLLASGYIGFAQYAGYLWPSLGSRPLFTGAVAAAVGIATIALLYRNIVSIAKLTVILWIGALLTLVIVTVAAFTHADLARAFTVVPGTVGLSSGFFFGLGTALLITLYDYAGYNDVCAIGDEVAAPARTIPRSIVLSILIVAALYIVMNVGILAAVPWESLVGKNGADPPPDAQYIAARVVEQAWGATAAKLVTLLVLWTAFASTFGLLLGFSRIPYAAAADGAYFAPFARLHPRGKFPYVGLLVIGGLALPFSFLSLPTVIAALTTGMVVVQSIAQIAAVFTLRARGVRPPFTMWLYPLPAVIALIAWIYVFITAGTSAIAFGILTPLAGLVAYLVWSKRAARWPFAQVALALALAAGASVAWPAAARAADFRAGAIVRDHGYPVFTVDGKPFFVWGSAFFYERMPPGQWRRNLEALRPLGVNTIDLYVMWNWHEPAEGQFDFDGHTDPRRNLREVLRLVTELGFHVTLRPGPVIRNEWRNGGYPAWLLQRPEYGMPLHDILEGRYPATATLQNAHADDAAAEWFNNATHMSYAQRWLTRVLREVAPYAQRVIAIQLDDDQGAYIDNQTWPAPHLAAYLRRLQTIVQASAGPHIPIFINTYQMKVTASAPVWAWGNWYQSDARLIGEHDRVQLEFSTGLLQTQPATPVMMSEFQAGWLAPPEEIRARDTDPSNTLLALHSFLAMGGHGIIDFPMQDTISPAGWEAPFANGAYLWNAALDPAARPNPRYAPTREFGATVHAYGAALARSHRVADAAIAYLTSAFDPQEMSNERVFDIAARTQEAQTFCRHAQLTCDLIDLRYAGPEIFARYRAIVIPRPAFAARAPLRYDPAVAAKLEAFRKSGRALIVAASFTDRDPLAATILEATHARRIVEGIDGATVLQTGDGRAAFLDVANYDALPLEADARVTLPGRAPVRVHVRVGARSAVLLPLQPNALTPPALPAPAATAPEPGGAEIDDVVLGPIAGTTVVIRPQAGARAFALHNDAGDALTSVGALRDDVLIQPPPSLTDRIAKYTHTFPAGFFNRPYACAAASEPRGAVACTYDAPDVVPHGARFEKIFAIDPDGALEVRASARFPGDEPQAAAQRLVSYTSLAIGGAREGIDGSGRYVLTPAAQPFVARHTYEPARDGAIGLYDAATKQLATIVWPAGDVEAAALQSYDFSLVAKLTFAPGTRRSYYRLVRAESLAAAQTLLRAQRDALPQGRRSACSNAPSVGEVAERSTQSPQKRPGESPCGFKSHLPQAYAGVR